MCLLLFGLVCIYAPLHLAEFELQLYHQPPPSQIGQTSIDATKGESLEQNSGLFRYFLRLHFVQDWARQGKLPLRLAVGTVKFTLPRCSSLG